MTNHADNKKYKGIYPKTKKDLFQARIELGQYFREIWKDELGALEVELAVTKKNYEKQIGTYIIAMLEEKSILI